MSRTLWKAQADSYQIRLLLSAIILAHSFWQCIHTGTSGSGKETLSQIEWKAKRASLGQRFGTQRWAAVSGGSCSTEFMSTEPHPGKSSATASSEARPVSWWNASPTWLASFRWHNLPKPWNRFWGNCGHQFKKYLRNDKSIDRGSDTVSQHGWGWRGV